MMTTEHRNTIRRWQSLPWRRLPQRRPTRGRTRRSKRLNPRPCAALSSPTSTLGEHRLRPTTVPTIEARCQYRSQPLPTLCCLQVLALRASCRRRATPFSALRPLHRSHLQRTKQFASPLQRAQQRARCSNEVLHHRLLHQTDGRRRQIQSTAIQRAQTIQIDLQLGLFHFLLPPFLLLPIAVVALNVTLCNLHPPPLLGLCLKVRGL